MSFVANPIQDHDNQDFNAQQSQQNANLRGRPVNVLLPPLPDQPLVVQRAPQDRSCCYKNYLLLKITIMCFQRLFCCCGRPAP